MLAIWYNDKIYMCLWEQTRMFTDIVLVWIFNSHLDSHILSALQSRLINVNFSVQR